MKAKLKTPEPDTFSPVTIEITFETVQELAEFYARHNIDIYELKKSKSYPIGYYSKENERGNNVHIFNLISEFFK